MEAPTTAIEWLPGQGVGEYCVNAVDVRQLSSDRLCGKSGRPASRTARITPESRTGAVFTHAIRECRENP